MVVRCWLSANVVDGLSGELVVCCNSGMVSLETVVLEMLSNFTNFSSLFVQSVNTEIEISKKGIDDWVK